EEGRGERPGEGASGGARAACGRQPAAHSRLPRRRARRDGEPLRQWCAVLQSEEIGQPSDTVTDRSIGSVVTQKGQQRHCTRAVLGLRRQAREKRYYLRGSGRPLSQAGGGVGPPGRGGRWAGIALVFENKD